MLRRLCLLSVLTLTACGSDVTVAEKQDEQTTHPDGGTPQSVACGNTLCRTKIGPISDGVRFEFLPCCHDEGQSSCGIIGSSECHSFEEGGHIDSSCGPPFPNFFPPFLGVVQGCCHPDNTCGLQASQLGSGCTDPADLADLFGLANLPGLTSFPVGTCKYNP